MTRDEVKAIKAKTKSRKARGIIDQYAKAEKLLAAYYKRLDSVKSMTEDADMILGTIIPAYSGALTGGQAAELRAILDAHPFPCVARYGTDK